MDDAGPKAAAWIAIGFIGVSAIGAFIALSVTIGEDFAIPAMITIAITAAVILRGPVGKAIARRLDADTARGDSQAVMAELDDLRAHVGELEERLDFAERLLAQQREPARVEPGRG